MKFRFNLTLNTLFTGVSYYMCICHAPLGGKVSTMDSERKTFYNYYDKCFSKPIIHNFHESRITYIIDKISIQGGYSTSHVLIYDILLEIHSSHIYFGTTQKPNPKPLTLNFVALQWCYHIKRTCTILCALLPINMSCLVYVEGSSNNILIA